MPLRGRYSDAPFLTLKRSEVFCYCCNKYAQEETVEAFLYERCRARAVQTCAWMTLYSELSQKGTWHFPASHMGPTWSKQDCRWPYSPWRPLWLDSECWRLPNKSLHSGAYIPLTVLQATPIIYLTGSTLCCGAQVQSVSMRLLKETSQNTSTGASHLLTWFHRSYPSSGNSVQPLSLSYLSGHQALGGLYCLKDSTSFLLFTVVACYLA